MTLSSNNIPTDNLYKFIAISGLIIFILSLILPYSHLQKYYFERLKIFGQYQILSLERDYLKKDTQELREDTKSLKAKAQKLKNGVQSEALLIQEKLGKLIEKERLLEIKETELSNINEQINYMIDQIGNYRALSRLCMVISPLIVLIGFVLWYFKTQRYQDEILRKNAEK